jgi:hypothetical protein
MIMVVAIKIYGILVLGLTVTQAILVTLGDVDFSFTQQGNQVEQRLNVVATVVLEMG